MNDFKRLLENDFPKEKLFYDEPMRKHTTFRIGGCADVFACPSTILEVCSLIELCNTQKTPFFMMGNGSNLLVGDKGIRGVVISLSKNFSNIACVDGKVKAQSGALLSAVAHFAYTKGLAGMAFAAGIPGTMGGAVCMNAGAYGGEMKQIIDTVCVYDHGEIKTYQNEELGFDYRTSRIQKEGLCVLEATLALTEGDPHDIKQEMTRLNQLRNEKQPVDKPSAGSTFKRPEGYFAGKLIMDAGLQGFSVGGAQVSTKHAGFVINTGNATAADVLGLVAHVKAVVFETSGIKLQEEIKYIGE